MTGTVKLKLLIVGKSKNPRRFNEIKSLATNYDFNKQTWMTLENVEKCLIDIDNKMSQDKRKIIFFIIIFIIYG